MKLQYVFGNPIRKHKKGRKSMAKRHHKKKRRGRKNPMSLTLNIKDRKTKKSLHKHKSNSFSSPSELRAHEANLARLKEKKSATKKRKDKRKLGKQIAKLSLALKAKKLKAKIEKKAFKEEKHVQKTNAASFSYRKGDRDILATKKEYSYFKKGESMSKRRKKRKKVSHKRKASHKKVRRSKKRKASHKRVRRSRKAKTSLSVVVKAGRRKSARFTIKNPRRKHRRMRNPISLSQPRAELPGNITLTQAIPYKDLLSLTAGGALYGFVNSLGPRIPMLGSFQSMLMRVPVVGPALFPVAIALGLHLVCDKLLKNESAIYTKAIRTVADGLVGASIVGIGVNISQMIPFLAAGSEIAGVQYTPDLRGMPPQLGGVQFTPGFEGIPAGLGSGADFGSQADFGGVQFTPGMDGVQFTPEMSGADFGGPGEGQMS